MALPTANDKGNKKGKKGGAAAMLQNSKFAGKSAKPANVAKKQIKTGGTRGS